MPKAGLCDPKTVAASKDAGKPARSVGMSSLIMDFRGLTAPDHVFFAGESAEPTLGIRSVPTRRLWRGALARALNSDVAAYDTLFVELAVRERRPLVTFDARLLAAFPDVATRPNALSVK